MVRLGPLAVLPPLRAGLETFVLGHLFDRYLERAPRAHGASGCWIELEEANAVRGAIERAVLRAASTEAGFQWERAPLPPVESRDDVTQALDGLLSATTIVPSWLVRRLDAAFDDTLALALPEP